MARFRYWMALVFCCSTTAVAENVGTNPEAKLRADLGFLCDDTLSGRGVGSDGIQRAANYIAESFAISGLRVDLFDGKPFQTFPVPISATLGPAEQNRLALIPLVAGGNDPRVQEINGELDRSFRPMAIGDSGAVDAELVFAGYGVTAPEFGYDDYAKIDVRGRVVVLVRKEPSGNGGKGQFNRAKNSRHAYFETKLKNALDHGAVGVLLVNDPDSIRSIGDQINKRIAEETRRLEKLDQQLAALPPEAISSGQSLRTRRDSMTAILGGLQRQRADAAGGLMDLGEAGESAVVPGLPVMSLSRVIANQLMRAAGYESLDETTKRIDRTMRPSSTLLAHRVKLQTQLNPSIVNSSNVLGVLEGKGKLAEETVIVGAHYDHVGMGGYGSLAPGTVAIHNGADDNASGTAALLSSVARIQERLRAVAAHRRIVFVAFTGEERGLLGSEYYVDHPRFPLEKTVAMINLDMVGRLRDNDLTVYGTGSAGELNAILENANQATGFKLFKVASGYGPSDHQSFYTHNVPVLFFFTGLHNDYHRPTDDFDKINFIGLTRITDITSGVAAELASRPERPQYAATERDVSIRWQATAYLGVQLRESSDGVIVSAVTAGSAAELAGLKVGDRLQKLNDTNVGTAGEVLEVIRACEANDPVRIELQRDAETMQVTAILQNRPS